MRRKELWSILRQNKQEIIDRYLNGESCKQIGESLGLQDYHIWSYLEKWGIDRRNVKDAQLNSLQNKLTVSDISRLYHKEKKTCKEIGDIYECSEATIRKFMRNNNINRRSRSENAKMSSRNHWTGKSKNEVRKIKKSIVSKTRKYSENDFKEMLKMNGYKTDDEFIFSTSKMNFICSNGHKWSTSPRKIMTGGGCPHCLFKNQTIVYNFLKSKYNVEREYPLCNYEYNGNVCSAYVDFYYEHLGVYYVVEYNGCQHYEPRQFGGMSKIDAIESFKKQKVRDTAVDKYCKENNIVIKWIDGRTHQGYLLTKHLKEEYRDE